MKQKLKKLGLILCFLLAFFCASPAYASCGCRFIYEDGTEKSVLGTDTYIFGEVEHCSCDDGSGNAIIKRLVFVIDLLMGGIALIGIISLIMVGLTYMTARDSEAQVAQAKQRTFDIVVGLVASTLIWSVLNMLVPGGLFRATEDSKISEIVALSDDEVGELEKAAEAQKNKVKRPKPTGPGNGGGNATDIPSSSPDTTFTIEYIATPSSQYANYLIYTPSTANGRKLPLVIYFHGGSGGGGGDYIKNIVGADMFTNWRTKTGGLDGVNAYIMFPQRKSGNWFCGGAGTSDAKARDQVWEKVREMVLDGRVNPYMISVWGQSNGSKGAQCFSNEHSDQVAATVLLSMNAIIAPDITQKLPTSTISCANNSDGALTQARNLMNVERFKTYSEQGYNSHDGAVRAGIKDDTDPHNNKSDVFEWIFTKTSRQPVR